MDASKIFLTGTVKSITKTETGTIFVSVKTIVLESLDPLKSVVMVKGKAAESLRVQQGDYIDVFGGTLYRVQPDGTLNISVKEPDGVHVCAKDDGFIDAASELL